MKTYTYTNIVLSVVLLFVVGVPASAGTPLIGATRWDAWSERGLVQDVVEECLGPEQWRYRCPFFTEVTGPDSVSFDRANTQAVMDQEIRYAANAGIDYWNFVHYDEDGYHAGMTNGLKLYLNSSIKDRVNFTVNLQAGIFALGLDHWSTVEVPRQVNYFKEPTYQKVLGNRPLVYMFYLAPEDAQIATAAFDSLRSATIAAGLGAPYYVIQGWYAPDDESLRQAVGADAIGAYAFARADGSGGTIDGTPYATLAAENVEHWDQQRTYGNGMVPLVTSGWDPRPLAAQSIPWGSWSENHCLPPTPTELGNHLTDAFNFIKNHPSAVPSNALLMYAWNEHAEGGWLCPTLSDTPGHPDTSRLDAIQTTILKANLLNASFESPSASTGWYRVPPGGMSSSFGWSNNLPSGYYALATPAAAHFSSAADGSQALLLGCESFISQSLGETSPDTSYTLSFSILHDNYDTQPSGALRAEIFDGETLLSYGDFTVPGTPDLWQEFTLTAVTSDVVSGDLIVKFTGLWGMPWLDDISLSARSIMVVPEPNTFTLLNAVGVSMLLGLVRRRRCQQRRKKMTSLLD